MIIQVHYQYIPEEHDTEEIKKQVVDYMIDNNLLADELPEVLPVQIYNYILGEQVWIDIDPLEYLHKGL